MTDDAAEATDSHRDETADADGADPSVADGEAASRDEDTVGTADATDADGTDETGADETGADAAETEAAAEAEPAVDPDSTAEGLAARVEAHDEELAAEVRSLEARIDELEGALAEKSTAVDEATSRLKRTQADFQNYKKRAKERQARLKETATKDFVERVVTVRDNLLRALDQDEGVDIRDGVESTLAEFDRILGEEGVSTIEPETGEEVDPHRHEVMLRVDSDQPEGTVVDVYQPGYEMGDRVVRAAQVTVSNGENA